MLPQVPHRSGRGDSVRRSKAPHSSQNAPAAATAPHTAHVELVTVTSRLRHQWSRLARRPSSSPTRLAESQKETACTCHDRPIDRALSARLRATTTARPSGVQRRSRACGHDQPRGRVSICQRVSLAIIARTVSQGCDPKAACLIQGRARPPDLPVRSASFRTSRREDTGRWSWSALDGAAPHVRDEHERQASTQDESRPFDQLAL